MWYLSRCQYSWFLFDSKTRLLIPNLLTLVYRLILFFHWCWLPISILSKLNLISNCFPIQMNIFPPVKSVPILLKEDHCLQLFLFVCNTLAIRVFLWVNWDYHFFVSVILWYNLVSFTQLLNYFWCKLMNRFVKLARIRSLFYFILFRLIKLNPIAKHSVRRVSIETAKHFSCMLVLL